MQLFVYGTLKTGCKNHYLMVDSGAVYMGDGICSDGYLLNLGPFPGFVRFGEVEEPVERDVRGEVYDVTDAMLKRFDRFEGVPNLYTRQVVKVFMADRDELVECFVYEIADKQMIARGVLMPLGEWVE